MTIEEHLLSIVAEECNEVAQRVSKVLRFGLDEIEPDQTLTNAERVMAEFDDLLGIVYMCQSRALLPGSEYKRVKAKQERVAKYLVHARACGTITNS
jgi:hypothetical protein